MQTPVEIKAPDLYSGPSLLKKHPAYVCVEHAPKAIHPVVPLVVHFELAV